MREAAADVATISKSVELWSPIYTPIWLHEVEHLVEVRHVKKAAALGLSVFCECLDDPSAKISKLNFWAIFNLCALADLGEATVIRMINDDTLALWLDQMDALLDHYGSGHLSLQTAMRLAQSVYFDPIIVDEEDCDILCEVFKKASTYMSNCLYERRLAAQRKNHVLTDCTNPAVIGLALDDRRGYFEGRDGFSQ
jgi:hypothetical protein